MNHLHHESYKLRSRSKRYRYYGDRHNTHDISATKTQEKLLYIKMAMAYFTPQFTTLFFSESFSIVVNDIVIGAGGFEVGSRAGHIGH